MQRFAWCFMLSMAPGFACAAELLRCVAADGAVSYQDTPCGAGSRLTKTIAVPEAAPAQERVVKSKAAKSTKAKTKSDRGGAKPAKSDNRNRQRQACAAARAEEKRVLDGVGLERTFEQLRTLGDKVQAACKGL